MKITIKKSEIEGRLKAPPSKSYTHRAVICAALANGRTKITNPLLCDDTYVTIKVCKTLGAEVNMRKDLIVEGTEKLRVPDDVMDCGGSGTTFRFFTAISSLVPGMSVLTGNESLRKRPVGELLNALTQLGIKAISTRGNGLPPIVVFGDDIKGGYVKMRGDISSQFISALLFACPKSSKKTTIELTSELQSKPYVEITIEVLKEFGIEVSVSEDFRGFIVPPQQSFKPWKYTIQGDFSSAAFMLAAGALAGKVKISNLELSSKQGDRRIVQILRQMNAYVKEKENSVTVEKEDLIATTIDVLHTPDLAPVCAVLATQAKGITRIINADRLRLKESNRLASITNELKKMGANINEVKYGLTIKGPTHLKGANIDPHNDHRIAMACAVAGLVASGRTVIENAECISKSYPAFVDDMKKLGVELR
jgi:3-phosphoshikimate 1-carboxyvinyltransferase